MIEALARNRINVNVGDGVLPIDAVSLDWVLDWVLRDRPASWDIAVTPNLHHLRIALESPTVRERYSRSSLSLADGWPVAWLGSRVSGSQVNRLSGADLFQQLIAEAGRGRRLVLVGGDPGPELNGLVTRCTVNGWLVSTEPAPRDELTDRCRRQALLRRISQNGRGGIVVVGVGAPRQEELAEEIAATPGSGVILCLGMSINFSSGSARRAPRVIQSLHLEWAFRALQEPKRLLSRYIADGAVLLRLARQNPRAHRGC